GLQRVAAAHRFQVATVEQLQELDDELHVADAAVTGLDVDGVLPGQNGTAFDAALERFDLVNLGKGEVLPVHERLDGPQECFAQGHVPGDGADLDERLPLPGAAQRVVVG